MKIIENIKVQTEKQKVMENIEQYIKDIEIAESIKYICTGSSRTKGENEWSKIWKDNVHGFSKLMKDFNLSFNKLCKICVG